MLAAADLEIAINQGVHAAVMLGQPFGAQNDLAQAALRLRRIGARKIRLQIACHNLPFQLLAAERR